jgi:hypothetical protein
MRSGLLYRSTTFLNLALRLHNASTSSKLSNSREGAYLLSQAKLLSSWSLLKTGEVISDVPSPLTEIHALKPVFHFFIHKVDKQIYKNSRGKSGKYSFTWKYIPVFKRRNFLTHKLCKEIKLDASKSFLHKILSCFSRHAGGEKRTLVSKTIKFTNNYLFFNHRSTILQNYRTIKS